MSFWSSFFCAFNTVDVTATQPLSNLLVLLFNPKKRGRGLCSWVNCCIISSLSYIVRAKAILFIEFTSSLSFLVIQPVGCQNYRFDDTHGKSALLASPLCLERLYEMCIQMLLLFCRYCSKCFRSFTSWNSKDSGIYAGNHADNNHTPEQAGHCHWQDQAGQRGGQVQIWTGCF